MSATGPPSSSARKEPSLSEWRRLTVVLCPDGVDPEELNRYKRTKKGIKGFLHATGKDGKEFVKEDAIYEEWYLWLDSAISLSLPPSSSQLIATMLTASSAN